MSREHCCVIPVKKSSNMDYWITSLLLLLNIKLNTGSTPKPMMISQDNFHVLNEGESIELYCDFYQDDYDLFHQPVLWLKQQQNEESPINIMGNINDPFLQTERYSVDFVENTAPRYRLLLRITAAVDHILITDTRNFSLIDLHANSPETLSFVENEPSTLRCIALGGNPAPSIDIYIGKEHVSPRFDFHNSVQLVGERGLRVISRTSQRWIHNFRPSPEYDGKKLRCTVTVPGLKQVTEAIWLTIDYSPRVTCTTVSAYVADRNVCLTCEIRAKPKPFSIFWILDANSSVTLTPGEVINECWTVIEEKEPGIQVAKLFMRQARPSSFKTYSLVVENSVSLKTQEVQLVLKKPRESVKQPFKLPDGESGSAHSDKSTDRPDRKPKQSSSSYHIKARTNAQPSNKDYLSVARLLILVLLATDWTVLNFLHCDWLLRT